MVDTSGCAGSVSCGCVREPITCVGSRVVVIGDTGAVVKAPVLTRGRITDSRNLDSAKSVHAVLYWPRGGAARSFNSR